MRQLLACAVISSSLFCSPSLFSQAEGFFRAYPMGLGGRAAALGDAYGAQTSDASIMYWNPGGLAFLERFSVVASSMIENRSDIAHHSIAVPARVGNEQTIAGAIAGSYFGSPWYHPILVSQGIDLAYAMKLSHSFGVGALLNVRYGETVRTSLWAASGSLGLLYYPSPGISYGATYQWIGTGFSYERASDKTLATEKLPGSLRIGTTFRFPTTANYSTMNISLASEFHFGDRRVQNKAGVEFSPWKFLALRLGIAERESTPSFRCGAGLRIGGMQMDYAFAASPVNDQYHHASLSIAFGRAN